MLNRLSVNTLLKSVIALLSAAVVSSLAIGAWTSWTALTTANRIAAVTEASGELFKALHNIRLDRTGTFRDLVGDAVLTAVHPQVRHHREVSMPEES